MRINQIGQTTLRVGAAALVVLMVPLVASQFFEDWHWGVGGFIRVYVLFFLTGMVIVLVARRMSAWSYKAGVGVALVSGLALGWSNMVQVADLGHPENLLYCRVLAATLALIALILPSGAAPDMARRMAIGHGIYMVMFIASGLMFRHANSAGLT